MQTNSQGIDSEQVALAHDAMASEYDQCNDYWYAWLYTRIHEFIAYHLPYYGGRPLALDVGCGTGFQSFLLARAGYDVTAFDLAEKLIEVAKAKLLRHAAPPLSAPPLFQSNTLTGIQEHNARIARILEEKRSGREISTPKFITADIMDFDFGLDRYDVIVSCGSVLSFIDDYEGVLERMAASLKKGGFLFLELEQKRNLDLLWPIIDILSGGKLGYEQAWNQSWQNLFSPRGRSIRIDYPFELQDGKEIVLPMWLFSVNELNRIFRNSGLRPLERKGIHWATNLIPSTILHKAVISPFLKKIMAPLMFVDESLGRLWPMWRFGCSVIFRLRKEA